MSLVECWYFQASRQFSSLPTTCTFSLQTVIDVQFYSSLIPLSPRRVMSIVIQVLFIYLLISFFVHYNARVPVSDLMVTLNYSIPQDFAVFILGFGHIRSLLFVDRDFYGTPKEPFLTALSFLFALCHFQVFINNVPYPSHYTFYICRSGFIRLKNAF